MGKTLFFIKLPIYLGKGNGDKWINNNIRNMKNIIVLVLSQCNRKETEAITNIHFPEKS